MKPQVSGCLAVKESIIGDEEEEEIMLEDVKKELPRGKKHLSGAQRRKLSIQKALAAGEKVIPRSERSQKGKKHNERVSSSGCSIVVSGSVKSEANGRLEVSPGMGAAHSALEQEISSNSVCSYRETLTSVKMVVVSKGFPDVKITEEQNEALQEALLDRILMSTDGQPLQVLSTQCTDGAVFFNCANRWTAAWLEETVADLSPWGGARLKAGPANAVMRLAKVLVWVPKPASAKGTPEILELIQKQNIGVHVTEWKIVSRKDMDHGASLVIVVNEKSFKVLRGHKFKLYLGMGQVSLKPLTKPPGYN